MTVDCEGLIQMIVPITTRSKCRVRAPFASLCNEAVVAQAGRYPGSVAWLIHDAAEVGQGLSTTNHETGEPSVSGRPGLLSGAALQ